MRDTEVLNDPNTSDWLRNALQTALKYDAVSVANDIEILRLVLHTRLAEAQGAGGDRAQGAFAESWTAKPAP